MSVQVNGFPSAASEDPLGQHKNCGPCFPRASIGSRAETLKRRPKSVPFGFPGLALKWFFPENLWRKTICSVSDLAAFPTFQGFFLGTPLRKIQKKEFDPLKNDAWRIPIAPSEKIRSMVLGVRGGMPRAPRIKNKNSKFGGGPPSVPSPKRNPPSKKVWGDVLSAPRATKGRQVPNALDFLGFGVLGIRRLARKLENCRL